MPAPTDLHEDLRRAVAHFWKTRASQGKGQSGKSCSSLIEPHWAPRQSRRSITHKLLTLVVPTQNSMARGFSICSFKHFRKIAASAPSMTRWSKVRFSPISERAVT